MTLAAGETLTRHRPGGRDQFDNPLEGEDEDLTLNDCVVWPKATSESTFAQDSLTEVLTVLAPYGSDVKAGDQIIRNELPHEVVGQPFDWQSELTGTKAGLQFDMTRSSG